VRGSPEVVKFLQATSAVVVRQSVSVCQQTTVRVCTVGGIVVIEIKMKK